MGKPAGPGARADDGAAPVKPKRKNANKIITLLERNDMLYAGLDVHRDTIRAGSP